MPDLPKVYDPSTVEPEHYQRWQESGFFRATTQDDSAAYCIVIPPPNITGSLHLGHALNNTLQDILVRWRRMQGLNVLWMPGTDHAGIATQNVVERQIREEGTDREALGREKFVERVWQWREQYGRTITGQLKRFGASCDWSRERFTLDEGLSKAVQEVFVRLHEEGLIYRGKRLINWCPRCRTALSDIEVEHQERKGKLYTIRYPLTGDPKKYLSVATTRPETLLGDTAVAVHPDDPRFNTLIGKSVCLPLTSRQIPIVGDPILVDREFGTGAVKITPAHDFNDFEAGLRHDLPRVAILDEEARILSSLKETGVDPSMAQAIAGQTVPQARQKILEQLEIRGDLLKVEDHRLSMGHCYRCKTIVEPFLSAQWFVRIQPLAGPAIEAVRSGRIRLIPSGWENSYFAWMQEIKDWCISRQIWWGHRIPVWYCQTCPQDDGAKPIVARQPPAACPDCKGTDLLQDPDVLDTWFSSALWPFSTLGWPEQTPELKCFYPTSVLVTSFDIIFFWVARMIMMGLKFMGDVPFRQVYLHALVRDAEGQKMSKSKGNVIDPLVTMEKHGTDSLRFTLSSMASPGRDVKLSEQRIEGYRNFANKIWNAARYILGKLDTVALPENHDQPPGTPSPLSLADRWIISRTQGRIEKVNQQLEQFRFDEASHQLYQFTWHEFCDWYIEFSKIHLVSRDQEEQAATIHTLITTFEVLLRLLHPFMPFITEDLWRRIPAAYHPSAHGVDTLMRSPYPVPQPERLDPTLEKEMQQTITLITQIRRFCREMKIPPSTRLPAAYQARVPGQGEMIRPYGAYIQALGQLSVFEVGTPVRKSGKSVTLVLETGELVLSLPDSLDLRKTGQWIRSETLKVKTDRERLEKRLHDPAFQARAPREVVAQDEKRLRDLKERHGMLAKVLEQLGESR